MAIPAILADCFQSAMAMAWLDADGDGVWDDTEHPLEGIAFVLEPTVYSRTKIDANGTANIFATTPGGNCTQRLRVTDEAVPALVGYGGMDAGSGSRI